MTVPQSAEERQPGDAICADTPYSLRMPGTTKPRLAGFITSMTRATVSTAISRQCAAQSGASSGALIATPVDRPALCGRRPRGSSP